MFGVYSLNINRLIWCETFVTAHLHTHTPTTTKSQLYGNQKMYGCFMWMWIFRRIKSKQKNKQFIIIRKQISHWKVFCISSVACLPSSFYSCQHWKAQYHGGGQISIMNRCFFLSLSFREKSNHNKRKWGKSVCSITIDRIQIGMETDATEEK